MNPLVFVLLMGAGLVPLCLGMVLGYQYSPRSAVYATLTICYFFAASIATLDMRLIQARMQGNDCGQLPAWTVIFGWLQWGIFCVLAVLNWRAAIGIFVLKFILKFIPVLETIGNVLMAPFKPSDQIENEPNRRTGTPGRDQRGINPLSGAD